MAVLRRFAQRRLQRSNSRIHDRMVAYAFNAQESVGPPIISASYEPRGRLFGISFPLINPEKSSLVRLIDSLSIIGLIFVAAVTPFEVAFMETKVNLLYVINRCVDLIFLVDLVMNFGMMYAVKTDYGSVLETNHDRILRRYFRGWFAIDLLSILPFDSLGIFFNSQKLKSMKVIKIIRLLRLLKLVRVVKASRLFKKWETTTSISHANVSLFRFFVAIIVAGHWLGCLWGLTGLGDIFTNPTFKNEYLALVDLPTDGKLSWVTVFCGCTDCADVIQCGYCVACQADTFELYVASLHYSVMTLTSIGYGDIVGTYAAERFIGCLVMLCSGILWAYIIGSACGVIANMDQHDQRFNQIIDDLNFMMKDKGMPRDMQLKLRVFFHQTKENARRSSYKDIMSKLSPTLHGETALFMYRIWMPYLTLLRGTSRGFRVKIASSFYTTVFAPGESFGEEKTIYIMCRGLVARRGRVWRSSSVWGDDLLLESPILRESEQSNALTYVEVICLTREKLEDIVKDFPQDQRILRLATLKIAFRRAIRVVLDRNKIKARKHTSILPIHVDSRSTTPRSQVNQGGLSAENQELLRLIRSETGVIKSETVDLLEKHTENMNAKVESLRRDIMSELRGVKDANNRSSSYSPAHSAQHFSRPVRRINPMRKYMEF